MSSEKKSYHALSVGETIEVLKSSTAGLSEKEAAERLEEYGYNELAKERDNKALTIFLDQFKNAFILLLVFAGILTLILGEELESMAIFGIILFNAILGFIQEYRAERAVEALKKLSANTARVVRNGLDAIVPAREIVPGDIVLLEAGDVVPADIRLSDTTNLQIDEASLTGESVPVKKGTEPVPEDAAVTEQTDMAFMGTVVTYGKGAGFVCRTGMETEFGRIAESLEETEDTKTPLQIKFERLARQIGAMAGVLIIIVFILGTLQGTQSFFEMLRFALALTVSTIPNSLPVIVTVSLSLGAGRLAAKKLLIKKLPAAESLGAVTVICSDKTGTLTKNEMTVTDIYYNGQSIKVSGSGYEPTGDYKLNGEKLDPRYLEKLLRIGFLCNDARFSSASGKPGIIGDPTEGALIVLAMKGGLDAEFKAGYSLVEEFPFDSDRKRMTKIYADKNSGRLEAYVKGAPDILLSRCERVLIDGVVHPLNDAKRQEILHMNEFYAEKALRVLGMAYREVVGTGGRDVESVESNLIFVGLVGMIDPPREEVLPAVEKCRTAGIRVVMITGDHVSTAKAVARQIGIFNEGDEVMTGKELSELSDEEIDARIERIRIIARALPIQKLRIVEALQRKGHVVAMTGDGVNDAPALKKADMGIAMGLTGTGVAKEVSDGILVDDNFASIVNAIEEGRDIYDKIIKSARYLLSCNCGEITCVFAAIVLKLPVPLLPLQILLMNLLTDDFPALGLGTEPVDKGVMKRPPRDPKAAPLTKKMFLMIAFFGIIMGAGSLYMFSQYNETDLTKARTMAFTTLVMFQMFAVLSSRTLEPSISHLNPLTNKWLLGAVLLSIAIQISVLYWPPLQDVFGTTALTQEEWAAILGLSALGFVLMEVSKMLVHTTVRNNHA